MDVKGSYFSDWTLLRAVKNVLLYFIPRFFVIDTKCFVSSTVIPNKKLYTICENMVNFEAHPEETKCEQNQFSFLMNGLTGVKNLNSPKPINYSEKYKINSNCDERHTEFGLYDKIIKIEDTFNFSRPEMKILFQFNCEMQMNEEKTISKTSIDHDEVTASTYNHVKYTDKDISSSLDFNENSKVCDNKELKVQKRNRRLKSRSDIKRAKKRTKCNNRRSRKAIKTSDKVPDEHDVIFEDGKIIKSEETSIQNDKFEEEMKVESAAKNDSLLEVQFDGVVEWSFVSDENEKDLSDVDRCSSIAYIIDTSDSLSFCLDDDDWDCVHDVGTDNDDLWESFQTTGLFVGNFTCDDTINGSASFEESQDDLNARIKLADVNSRWETELDSFIETCSKKKKLQVHFASNLVEVYTILESDDDSRKGPWEEYARDRERFTRRIEDLNPIISPILCKEHREKIYKQFYF